MWYSRYYSSHVVCTNKSQSEIIKLFQNTVNRDIGMNLAKCTNIGFSHRFPSPSFFSEIPSSSGENPIGPGILVTECKTPTTSRDWPIPWASVYFREPKLCCCSHVENRALKEAGISRSCIYRFVFILRTDPINTDKDTCRMKNRFVSRNPSVKSIFRIGNIWEFHKEQSKGQYCFSESDPIRYLQDRRYSRGRVFHREQYQVEYYFSMTKFSIVR